MKLLPFLLNKGGKKWATDVAPLTKKYANLPETYIKRSLERIEHVTPRGLPQYLPRVASRKVKVFGLHRPWTEAFWRDNIERKPKVFIEPVGEWSIFKGDTVEVLVGPDKGKQGTVARVIQERNWVTVEGLNTKMKVMGKTKTFPGTVILEEQPLLVTNEVTLIDPSDLKPTKIEWRFLEDGRKVRVSSRTGRFIPMPVQADETYDYKMKSAYKENPKDTVASDVTEITFKPTLSTFEMDIMKKMGIEEHRKPYKTYWY